MRSLRGLTRLKENLIKLKKVLRENQHFLPLKQISLTLKHLERAFRRIDLIVRDPRVDLYELAKSLNRKCNQMLNEFSKLDFSDQHALKDYLDKVNYLARYVFASYYDFTNKLQVIRRAYRLFIFSFVISIILAPLILRASIIFIGILMFPLFISIHAFRARRKLGLVIMAALSIYPLYIS